MIFMPILMRDILLPVLISTTYWLALYNGVLFLNLFVFVVLSIVYVYYCKWVNANYEYMSYNEAIDQ